MQRRLILEDERGDAAFEILEDRTLVGRDADCQVRLDRQKVSRRHLRIDREGRRLVAVDLGSSNGTLLNGVALVDPTELQRGDVLLVGDARLHVDAVLRRARPEGAALENRLRADLGKSRGRAPILVGGIALLLAAGLWLALPDDAERARDLPAAETTAALEDEAITADASPAEPAAALRPEERRELQDRGRAIATLRLEVEEKLVQSDFAAAEAAMREFERVTGRVPTTIRRAFDAALEAEAELQAKRFLDDVADGREVMARMRLRERLTLFPADTPARARLETLLAAPADAPEETTFARETPGEGGAAPRPGSPDGDEEQPAPARDADAPRPFTAAERDAKARDAFFARRGAADELLARSEYAAAAAAYAELVGLAERGGVDAPLLKDVARRRRVAERLAEMLSSLATAITEALASDPTRYPALAVGGGPRAHVLSATAEGLTLGRDGERLDKRWSELPAETIATLIARSELDDAVAVGVATFHLRMDRPERAHAALLKVEERAPALRPEIELALADHAGIDLPPGGYVVVEGVYVTKNEIARREARAVIEANVPKIRDRSSKVRAQAYDELRALGARGAAGFFSALADAKDALLAELEKSSTWGELAQLQEKKTELERRRARALALIFDEHEYPHPHDTPETQARHSRANQEIDRRILAIEEIWNDTSAVTIDGAMRGRLEVLAEYDRELAELKLGAGRPTPAILQHLPASGRIDVRTMAMDADERRRIDASIEVMRANAERVTTASAQEVRQVLITNEYRVSMGRHALLSSDTLLEAARMHSEDMSRDGFFAHENPHDPNKRWPLDRARWVGFFGVGMGENLAAGGSDAGTAHMQWRHSAGHHRNLLAAEFRVMASGNVGRLWTQMFAVREFDDEERERAGLPKGGFRAR